MGLPRSRAAGAVSHFTRAILFTAKARLSPLAMSKSCAGGHLRGFQLARLKGAREGVRVDWTISECDTPMDIGDEQVCFRHGRAEWFIGCSFRA